jgi:LPXTG-motif cell wall-anchored protein
MYLGQETKPGGTYQWVGAVKPLGDAASGIIGSIFGRPAGAPPPTQESGNGTNQMLTFAAVGIGALALGGLFFARRRKRR